MTHDLDVPLEKLSQFHPSATKQRRGTGARQGLWARLFWELSVQVRLPEATLSAIEAQEGALGHARCTVALSAAIAEKLGLGEGEVLLALMAGFLHNVGKHDVPERLLGCEERIESLATSEGELLRGHVRSARAVLADPRVAAALQRSF